MFKLIFLGNKYQKSLEDKLQSISTATVDIRREAEICHQEIGNETHKTGLEMNFKMDAKWQWLENDGRLCHASSKCDQSTIRKQYNIRSLCGRA